MAFSYRDLVVWRAAMQLAEGTYRLSAALPRAEMYGLTAQMRRSAVSVASNIAEGHARRSTRDFLRFISIALGSLTELETQWMLTARLGFVTETDTAPVLGQASEVGKMLHGLRSSLERRLSLAPGP